MTFDNSKTIIGVRIRLFAATVLLLAFIILTYAARLIKFPLLGLSDTTWTLILVAIYLVIAFLPMILNYQYIYYSDDNEKIVFRYFTSGIVGGKKNSVEVYKSDFAGYKTETGFMGMTSKIILFQKVGQGIAKYPPVHITALNKDERSRMYASLKKHAPEA